MCRCSYACLGLVVPSLTDVLLAEIRHRLATEVFNAQQLSNLLWALTILRLCTPEVRSDCSSHCPPRRSVAAARSWQLAIL
jgi:hypothetical protein